MKKILGVLGAIVLGLGLMQLIPEKEFKGYGVISDRDNKGTLEVRTLVPHPQMKEEKECTITNVSNDKVSCEEYVNGLTYTHSLNQRELNKRGNNKGRERGDRVESNNQDIYIGNTLKMRLSVLTPMTLDVHNQYIRLTPYEREIGQKVFIVGKYKGNDVKVKDIFKDKQGGGNISINGSNVHASINVCIPNKYDPSSPYTFLFYQLNGDQVNVYELFHPDVHTDLVGSGSILDDESKYESIKVLIMSPDMQEVRGIQELDNRSSLSPCYNYPNTPLPMNKGLVSSYSLDEDTSKPIPSKGITRSTSSPLKGLITLFWYVLFGGIGFWLMAVFSLL